VTTTTAVTVVDVSPTGPQDGNRRLNGRLRTPVMNRISNGESSIFPHRKELCLAHDSIDKRQRKHEIVHSRCGAGVLRLVC
jgi:hypothetical protein